MGNQVTKGERLLQAASEGDTQFVQVCMTQVDTREKLLLKSKTGFLHHNEGVLHLAAKRGQLHALTAVLGPMVDAVTLEIAEGQYPGPSAQLLTRLVNQTDSRGRTPFLTACHSGHWDCAEQLLEAGSNIFAVDRDGNCCLHLAAVNSHTEVVSQILTKAEAEAITLRLTSIMNLSGFTPLHYAAHARNAEITRQLLAAGVDPLQGTVADYDRWLVVLQGTTPLHVAAMSHQSGVCIMLLQHYALQLREWLPGDPLPVDPRTRIDNRGTTPLNVALLKGLTPNSQLAICLNPRLDVLSLFSDQQLDDVRRKGPQALKVLAAAAVKTKLLQQLRDLADQQQQMILMQQLERQQQQQRRSKQQQQQQRQRRRQKVDVQRWWRSGRCTDLEAPIAAAAAAGSSSAVQGYAGCSNGSSNQQVLDSPFDRSSAADIDQVPGSSSSSSRAVIKPVDQPDGSSSSSSVAVGSSSKCGASSSDEQVEDFLQGLKRTPSITIGAMHYTHDTNIHQQQQQQQQTGKKQDLASTAAAAAAVPSEIEAAGAAPAGPLEQHTADIDHSAAAAASSSSSRHSSPIQKLHSSSSITLACLDQVWKHSEQQQQQQQRGGAESHSEGAANKRQQQQTPEVAFMDAAAQQQQQQQQQHLVEQSSEIEADSGADQQQQQQCPQPLRPQSGLSQISTGSAAAADGAAAADCYEHINEHMHKAMGCTKSFQLVTPSATTTSSNSSSSSSVCEADVAHTSNPQQQQQQQMRPPTPKQQQEQPIRQRSLGVASITLAQLQRNGSSSGSSSVAGDAGNSSSNMNGFRSNGGNLGAQGGNNNGKVLKTAGIQNQLVMTPFALRLFQQQQKGYAAAAAAKIQQQQQPSQNFCRLPAASTGSSSSSRLKVTASPRSSMQSSYQTSHQSSHPTSHPTSQFRSPHRRSCELPGRTGSSMSAVFGASRQHIARMMEEAGTLEPRSMHQTLSRRGSMVVATSLAGALPGCVSTKLVQCLDLEHTSSWPHGLSSTSPVEGGFSHPSGLPDQQQQQQLPSSMLALGSRVASSTGPRRTGSIGFGGSIGGSSVQSNLGEVCAICCDRAAAVAVSSCGHTMCFECLRVIVQEGMGCRAPSCPFCRVNITDFCLAAAATAAPVAGPAAAALQQLALS